MAERSLIGHRVDPGSIDVWGPGYVITWVLEWGPQTWKTITSTSPNKIFSNAADQSAKKVEADRKRKASEKAKES